MLCVRFLSSAVSDSSHLLSGLLLGSAVYLSRPLHLLQWLLTDLRIELKVKMSCSRSDPWCAGQGRRCGDYSSGKTLSLPW